MSQERIQKIMAQNGVASRREAERMISDGLVCLNGKVVTELGVKIDPEVDVISVEGKDIAIMPEEFREMVYFLLHKPPRFLTSSKSQDDRATVMELVKGATDSRIFPVGRLDYDSSGALLLTNDGELTNKLLHPKYHVKKTYHVKVKGVPLPADLDKLRRGIYLEDGPTGPCEINVLGKAKSNTWVEVVLTQGKNRQIKRMFWRIKCPVQKLTRIKFGELSIENLPEGHYRPLTKKELRELQSKS